MRDPSFKPQTSVLRQSSSSSMSSTSAAQLSADAAAANMYTALGPAPLQLARAVSENNLTSQQRVAMAERLQILDFHLETNEFSVARRTLTTSFLLRRQKLRKKYLEKSNVIKDMAIKLMK